MKKICEVDFCNEAEPPGEQEVYHTPGCPQGALPHLAMLPAAAAMYLQNDAPNSDIFEILRVISSEKAFEFYYRNRAQLA